jgi:hypothetical protein
VHDIKVTMPHMLRRHRKSLASAALGLWLFALFLGIAHACTWDGVTTVTHFSSLAVHAGDGMADKSAPDCEDTPSNDLPLPSVLQLAQDPSGGIALLIATHCGLRLLSNSAPLAGLACIAHPPPGVPFSHRIVRLTL